MMVFCVASISRADPVTFYFGGTISARHADLASIISVGDSFSGSYTFDSLASDLSPDPSEGRYSLDSFSVTIGGTTATANPSGSTFRIVHDSTDPSSQDAYTFGQPFAPGVPSGIPGLLITDAEFGLVASDNTVFSSDSIFLSPPGLDQFAFNWFDVYYGGDDQVANGVLTYFSASAPGTTAPIPEPEIYAMLGLGFGVLGWVGRRRKHVV